MIKSKPVPVRAEHNAAAHLAYLRTYAAHAGHPHAPEVCRSAARELKRLEPQIGLL